MLLLDLLLFECRQPLQAEVQDRLGLDRGHGEPLDQSCPGIVDRSGAPDQGDDLVQVVQRDPVALEDVGSLLSLAEVEPGPAQDHLSAVINECLQHLFQAAHLRLVIHQGQHDHAEGGLHGGLLVELIHDEPRCLIPLQLCDDPHPFAV